MLSDFIVRKVMAQPALEKSLMVLDSASPNTVKFWATIFLGVVTAAGLLGAGGDAEQSGSATPQQTNSGRASEGGAGGMSRSDVAECEKNTAMFMVNRRVFANMAQFLGPQAAGDQLVEKLKGEGLSVSCIAYLNQNL